MSRFKRVFCVLKQVTDVGNMTSTQQESPTKKTGMVLRSGHETGAEDGEQPGNNGAEGSPLTDAGNEDPPLSMLLKVESVSGDALTGLLTEATVSAVIRGECGVAPRKVVVLSDRECAVLFGEAIGDELRPVQADVCKGALERMDAWVHQAARVSVTLVETKQLEQLAQKQLSVQLGFPGGAASRAAQPRPKAGVPTPTAPPTSLLNANQNAVTRQMARRRFVEESDDDGMTDAGMLNFGAPQLAAYRPSAASTSRPRGRRRHARSTGSETSDDGMTEGGEYWGSDRKIPTIKQFYGKKGQDEAPYAYWKASVKMLACQHTDSALKTALSRSLKGPAFAIWARIDLAREDWLLQLFKNLDVFYKDVPDYPSLRLDMLAQKQKHSESVADFAARVADLGTRLLFTFPPDKFPERAAELQGVEDMQKDAVWLGLKEYLRVALRPEYKTGRLDSFAALVTRAREVEVEEGKLRPEPDQAQGTDKTKGEPTKPQPKSILPNPVSRFYRRNPPVQSRLAQIEEVPSLEPDPTAESECEGTPEADAVTDIEDLVMHSMQVALETAQKNNGCFRCGEDDHFIRDCPLRKPKNSQKTGLKGSGPANRGQTPTPKPKAD